MSRGRATRAARRRERGSIHVASAAALLASIFAAVLAVDVGRVALERRRLQLQADVAALEASRRVGHCVPGGEDPAAAAQAAAARNDWSGNVGEAPNSVALGDVDTVDGVYQFTAGGDAANATAVQVTLTSTLPRSIVAGTLFPGSLDMSATAVGRRVAAAGLRAGSRFASVDSERSELLDQLFGEMLGTSVTLDALSYQGLADAHVTMGDLVESHATAGSVDELLGLSLGVGEYLTLVASALERGGNDAAAATVNDLASAAAGSPGSVEVGELISVGDGGDEAVLRSAVNAFDLAMFGSQFAAGDSAMSIDGPVVSVPGVADADLTLTIVEPPQIAVGPPGQDADGNWRTRTRTAQMRLGWRAEATTPLGAIGGAPVGLDFYAQLAPTEASLTTVECGAGSNVHRVRVLTEPGASTYGFGRFEDIENGDEVGPSTLVDYDHPGGLFGFSASAQSSVSATSGAEELIFDGPFMPEIEAPAEEHTQTVGPPLGAAVADGLGDVVGGTSIDLSVEGTLPVGITTPSLEQAIEDAAFPLLTSLDEIITPTLEVLGVHLGGADVTVGSLAVRPPKLVR